MTSPDTTNRMMSATMLNVWLSKIVSVDLDVLEYISYMYIITSFLVFVLLHILNVSAPYGRYARSGWGCPMNANMAWFIQELPAFMIPCALIFYKNSWEMTSLCSKISMACFLLHYFQRAFIFPLLIRGGKPTPCVPFVLALLFCIINGYLQVGYLLYHAPQNEIDCYTSPLFIAGIVMFLVGMAINIHSDHILRNLRKPGETGYVIPRGGMFSYVSGANFFGEILEWWGFFLTSPSLPSLAFAVFTSSNIGPRAVQHHRWYLQKFEDYPKNRKAVLPFIF